MIPRTTKRIDSATAHHPRKVLGIPSDPDGRRLQRMIQRRRRELGLMTGRWRQPVILSPELLLFILGRLL